MTKRKISGEQKKEERKLVEGEIKKRENLWNVRFNQKTWMMTSLLSFILV